MKEMTKDFLVVMGLYVISLFTGVAQEVLLGYSSDTGLIMSGIHWIVLIQVYFYIIKDASGRKKNDKIKNTERY